MRFPGYVFQPVFTQYFPKLAFHFLNHFQQYESESLINPEANTTELEAEIDQMVYELYGLTEEEVKVVEGNEPGKV